MEPDDYDDIGFDLEGLAASTLLERFVEEEVLAKASASKQRVSQLVRERRRRVVQQFQAPPFIRTVDKLSFCVGVLYLTVTEGILLAAPHRMHSWYLASILPLLLWRYMSYHRAKFHYFMLDFCYFAQVMLVFFLCLYPHSRILFQLVFCFSNGPLAWGIVAWNNSLVFHDLDKMTSCAIHIMPAIVTFCLRWYPLDGDLSGVCKDASCSLSLMEAIGFPMLFYVFWQLSYIVKTEFVDKAKLDGDEELVTSLRWMTEKRPHPIYKAIRKHQYKFRFGPFLIRHPSCLLMAVQLLYTLLTMLPILLVYASFRAHAAMLLFFCLVCMWNGANYYFEVFTTKYSKRIEALVHEAEQKAEQDDAKKQGEKDAKA